MTAPKWTNPSAFVDVCEALTGMLALAWAEGYRLAPGEKPVLKDGVRDQKIAAASAALSRARNEKETG